MLAHTCTQLSQRSERMSDLSDIIWQLLICWRLQQCPYCCHATPSSLRHWEPLLQALISPCPTTWFLLPHILQHSLNILLDFSVVFVQIQSPSIYVHCSRDYEHYLYFGDIFWIRLPLEGLINTTSSLLCTCFWSLLGKKKLTGAWFQWLALCLKFSNGFETPKWKMKMGQMKGQQKLLTWYFIHECNRNFCLALG